MAIGTGDEEGYENSETTLINCRRENKGKLINVSTFAGTQEQ